jgi:hypothetical protein
MNNTAILYPIAMQLLLIALVGVLTVTMRRKGALAGEIRISRFKVMNLEGIDAKYVTPGNSYNNQFQMPMLFIAFVLFALQLQLVDSFFIYASWAFVALRYAHAYVHLTYNNVIHRLLCFAGGVLVVFICWGRLIILAT